MVLTRMIDKTTLLVPVLSYVVHSMIYLGYVYLFGFKLNTDFYNLLGIVLAYSYHLLYYLLIGILSKKLNYPFVKVAWIGAGAMFSLRLLFLFLFVGHLVVIEFVLTFALTTACYPFFRRILA
jgi:hypothetical protein